MEEENRLLTKPLTYKKCHNGSKLTYSRGGRDEIRIGNNIDCQASSAFIPIPLGSRFYVLS